MNSLIKKILHIALRVLSWTLIAFTVFMMIFTIATVTTVDRNDRSILGLKFYIVQTDSMSPSDKNADLDVHFSAGDIIIIKNVEAPAKMEEGDIIAFISSNSESLGETVTHMIRRREVKDGRFLGYVTYGTNTGVDDEAIVEPSYILGEYAGKLPGFGNFFAFVRSTEGYILCILIPFLLLILYNGATAVTLFLRYKKEQTAIIEAERAEFEEGKKQNEELMKELLALKAQLAGQVNTEPENKTDEEADEATEEESVEETEEKSE